MNLYNLTRNITFEQIKSKIQYEIITNQVEDTTEDSETIADQSVYLTIQRSVYLYDSYQDENDIERNIKWRLTCELDLWVDQSVCKNTNQILQAVIDRDLTLESLTEGANLFIDGSEIEESEIEESAFLKEFAFKESDIGLLQDLVNKYYVRKMNSPYTYIATATMKDNGEVFREFFGLYSNRELSPNDDHTKLMKSFGLNSPYGVCMALYDHVDPLTGKIKENADLSQFSGVDIDYDLGYSLIDVSLCDVDDFASNENIDYLGIHFFEEIE